MDAPYDRDRFTPSELAVVLSHYDLGVVESAREFARGSRRAPKLILQTQRGRFLLKRRAAGRDDPFKVAFSHALQSHLRQKRFPVPSLVGTRDENNSLLQSLGRIYEMFEYVDGERFDGSLEQTSQAGTALARYHNAVRDFHTEWSPPAGSFHDAQSVRNGLNAIPTITASHDSVVGREAQMLQTTQELYERYEETADAVRRLGFANWPITIIHGDWHPGNMLFREGKLVCVIDFDAARHQPTVVDAAYGTLQFSILRSAADPNEWPAYFDESRLRRFMAAYLSIAPLATEMRRAVPLLMIEALIAETVYPIAATGSFGHMPGFGMLQMVRRKVRWLIENSPRLEKWFVE